MNSLKKSASKAPRRRATGASKPRHQKHLHVSAAEAAAVPALTAEMRRGAEQTARLLQIMARLRRPKDGCPWDLEQTLDSVKPHLIEEAYEALDALESGNRSDLAEELGDLLLQIVFQSHMASQEGAFSFADVAQGICDKLVRRHPHIFGEVKVADSKEVLRNWDAIKCKEKQTRVSALDGIPEHVPPLHRAYQLQKRAARVGFDWSDIKDVFAKLDEEVGELKGAVAKGSRQQVIEEIGDLIFSVVNVARFMKVDPAYALDSTNKKFTRRFRVVEDEITGQGRRMKDCTLQEMDAIWDRLRAADKKRKKSARR